jgi:hypothetical protein
MALLFLRRSEIHTLPFYPRELQKRFNRVCSRPSKADGQIAQQKAEVRRLKSVGPKTPISYLQRTVCILQSDLGDELAVVVSASTRALEHSRGTTLSSKHILVVYSDTYTLLGDAAPSASATLRT